MNCSLSGLNIEDLVKMKNIYLSEIERFENLCNEYKSKSALSLIGWGASIGAVVGGVFLYSPVLMIGGLIGCLGLYGNLEQNLMHARRTSDLLLKKQEKGLEVLEAIKERKKLLMFENDLELEGMVEDD